MADAAKKEKLAAARKKLKQFQQKRTPSNSPAPDNGTKAKLNGTNGTQGKGDTRSASGSPMRPSTPLSSKQSKESSIPSSPPFNQSSLNKSTYSTPVGRLQSPILPASASTEKLQQLSRQINGLITDSSAYLQNEDALENPSISDLENRNRELASLLQQHAQANEQLHKQLKELKSYNSKLQSSLDHERKGFDDKIKRELGSLKDQLQVHIQTIGILVAEKTELQSALNQSTKQSDTRSQEIEELQGRLKASRTRVAELERSFSSASSSSQKLEKSSQEFSKEIDRLKLELYKSNKVLEEQQQKNTELAGKLQTKAGQCGKAEDEILNLKGKLEMSQLHIEQLKNGGAQMNDSSEEIDKLVAERSELQVKVDQYEEAFQRLTTERDQLSGQYQQYIEQLTAKNQELQIQTVTLAEERDSALNQHSQLELSLNELQSQQDSAQTETSALEHEKHELYQNHAKLQADFEALKSLYDTQVADNSQLGRLISEKEMKLEELEMTVQRLGDSSVDRDQLLETMQSDKTALSRAMAQNKELKHQLAEIQNGFVKMSNDNMDLMTQLTSEQHISNELGHRLTQQEEELKELREQLHDSESQMKQLESDATILKTQHFSQDQIEDRLRHYEAQAHLVETLQRELNSAQDTINALTNQNSILQSHMASSSGENANGNEAGDNNSALVASMSASVKQLEMERNEVVQRLRDEEGRANDIHAKLQQLQNDLAHDTPATLNGDVISKAQFEALQHAMKQLEVKYTGTMRDKADLADKTEQLEHLIMQLQGETDTIGEYVTLYQHQRSVLKERAVEKDDYIARLSRERGEMQDKLGQLQALVMQLLSERQALHHYGQPNQASPTTGTSPTDSNTSPRSPAAGKKKNKKFGTTLDSSNLEDWPDYTSESDSEASEVEAIIGGSPDQSPSPDKIEAPHEEATDGRDGQPQWNIPGEDHTAKRIMNLLSEIGTSTLADSPTYAARNFVNCNRCTGRLLVL